MLLQQKSSATTILIKCPFTAVLIIKVSSLFQALHASRNEIFELIYLINASSYPFSHVFITPCFFFLKHNLFQSYIDVEFESIPSLLLRTDRLIGADCLISLLALRIYDSSTWLMFSLFERKNVCCSSRTTNVLFKFQAQMLNKRTRKMNFKNILHTKKWCKAKECNISF